MADLRAPLDRLAPEVDAGPMAQLRARMIVGYSLIAIITTSGLVAMYLGQGIPMGAAVMGGVAVVVLASLWGFRRTGRVEVGLAGLLVATLGGLIVFGAYEGHHFVLTDLWWVLVPLMAMFVAGWRAGVLWTGITLAVMLGLVALHMTGYALPGGFVESRAGFDTAILQIAGMGVVSLLAGLYTRLSNQLARAATRSERALSRLIESTDAMMATVDDRGRLTACNERFTRYWGQGSMRPGASFLDALPAGRRTDWQERIAAASAGARQRTTDIVEVGSARRYVEVDVRPAGGQEGVAVVARDVTALTEAEAARRDAEGSLREMAMVSGRAEAAEEILHNVGNVLTSVNVSSARIRERLEWLRGERIEELGALLAEHAGDLPGFFATDPRGDRIPDYLVALGRQLREERDDLLRVADALDEGMGHVREIISAQQSMSGRGGRVERGDVHDVIEAALVFKGPSFATHDIEVVRAFGDLPALDLDRHHLLQVLLNLFTNAAHAMAEADGPRILRVATRRVGGDRIAIEVGDTGCGIAPEHAERVFERGFTTRQAGSGFGLYFSAEASRRMGGALDFHSAGRGQGATFRLELPVPAEGSAGAGAGSAGQRGACPQ